MTCGSIELPCVRHCGGMCHGLNLIQGPAVKIAFLYFSKSRACNTQCKVMFSQHNRPGRVAFIYHTWATPTLIRHYGKLHRRPYIEPIFDILYRDLTPHLTLDSQFCDIQTW